MMVEEPVTAREPVEVAFANCKPPVNWLSVPEKVLESVRRVEDAAVTPVMAPHIIVLLEFVWRAFEPEHVPKVEANVVLPVFDIEKSVVDENVPAALVVEPTAKSVVRVDEALTPMPKVDHGEVVPTPTVPLPFTRRVEVPPEVCTSSA